MTTTDRAATERDCWVALNLAAGIGPIRFQHLLQRCGSAAQAWSASDFDLVGAGLERRTIDSLNRLRRGSSPAQIAAHLAELRMQALTLLDSDYPANLRQIADPPPVLFVRGTLMEADANAVAIVGTRRSSTYGHAVTERLAADLAASGVTVVSGLAKGIDTVAHRTTIDMGGRTLAVLGNGLDEVYPPANAGLAKRIVTSGALISEFPPGTPPDAVNFPRRNRIIAGLAHATVIVEAPHRSGALITADFALEQGRDVLVVPGSIMSPLSAGTNELLKQGAIPVTGVDDILAVLGGGSAPSNVARAVPQLAEQERSVWEALGPDPRHVDELARSLGGGAAGEISATLALLEMKGLARQVGSMLYTRA